ncbi:type I pullulanase [Bacillus sp. HMF5848]|uniref:type I pullulanase n=1 Tax=Bacillus sp. HMF5848 TaxID=2495421 RepID=UPI000F769B84|nr:type I pullulanase [Bacillus sp. HMF5848]RSK28222.1 type I pullulanase [Bacillus sp. HMF5848]
MLKIKRAFEAYLDALDVVTIILVRTYREGQSNKFTLHVNDKNFSLPIVKKEDHHAFVKYECRLPFYIKLDSVYDVEDEYGVFTDLQIGAVIRTKEFDRLYYYDGNDLGVTYTHTDTTFKVWAPTASSVKIKIRRPHHEYFEQISMFQGEKGVWTACVQGDLNGAQYTYLACVNLVWREAVDPYAKAVSMNGEYGVVVDLHASRLPALKRQRLEQTTDAIIYELHVRDFSIHPASGINHKGKYVAFTEKDTTDLKGLSTGIEYIKQLGVTHIELLPVNDFAGVDERSPDTAYNWGYNPLNFFAVEGSYATDPNDPYNRIYELKRAIRSIHEQGLFVILDVVYNHVFEREESSFEKLVPGYYFRYDQYGFPSNGTGVGNDIASERLMVRKFVLDCVKYWLNEYQVDGFRFDLMGILDIQTMNEVRKVCDEVDPTILLLGEGWDLNTPMHSSEKATIHNTAKMPRIAHFNDKFRDSIKGSTFNLHDKGFTLGSHNKKREAMLCIAGSVPTTNSDVRLFVSPAYSINYVESHDNHTLWDKLAKSNEHEDEAIRRRRHQLATSIVILSQGIPFIHAGQEFYRTKQGDANSYRSPDHINWLDWERRALQNADVDFIKGLIQLRKYHGAFRLSTATQIFNHMTFIDCSESVVAFHLQDVARFGPWKQIVVAFNNDSSSQYLQLPDSDWFVACDGKQVTLAQDMSVKGNEFEIPGISTIVLYK